MSTEPYFGAEIVDRQTEAGVVREFKAATAYLVGTAPIQEVHDTPAKRAGYIGTDIVIRKREDITTHFGPHREGYTIPRSLDAMFDQAEEKGIGTIVVQNVFDPDTHQDVGSQPDPAEVTNLDIMGTFDAAGHPSGLKRMYTQFQTFGWFPKHLLCPGFSLMPGVASEMQVISNRVRSRYYVDAPLGATLQQVIAARGAGGDFDFQIDSTRAVLCWPHRQAVDTDPTSSTAGEIVPEPYSARLCGVWLKSIMEYGYHHSPSNRTIEGDEGGAQEITYIPGDASDDTQLARGAGIVSFAGHYAKGDRTQGNRSAAYPASADFRTMLHIQFIEDMMDEAVLFFLDDRLKDRNTSPAKLSRIEEDINAYLASKSAGEDPVLYGGHFWFDKELTTPRSVLDGRVFYQQDYAPVGVAERITVKRGINLELIREPLGLSQTATGFDIAA